MVVNKISRNFPWSDHCLTISIYHYKHLALTYKHKNNLRGRNQLYSLGNLIALIHKNISLVIDVMVHPEKRERERETTD